MCLPFSQFHQHVLLQSETEPSISGFHSTWVSHRKKLILEPFCRLSFRTFLQVWKTRKFPENVRRLFSCIASQVFEATPCRRELKRNRNALRLAVFTLLISAFQTRKTREQVQEMRCNGDMNLATAANGSDSVARRKSGLLSTCQVLL